MQQDRELLLLRHAKSDWSTGASSDYERPLNPRGLKAAPKVGRWLADEQLLPDRVISSPAVRAVTTTELVCAELAIPVSKIIWEPGIYEASLLDLLKVIQDIPADFQRVLLVGHNPGLENMVAHLTGYRAVEHEEISMPTAAVARFKLSVVWPEIAPEYARLLGIQWVRPRK